ncbi:MAG: acyl carrier protein [Myxococcales bacterium]|nr:acyl carrier protein [Myxococcales bacterium]
MSAAPDWNAETLTQRVFEILRDEILDVSEGFTPQSNLVDAGLDSLAVTQLMLSIEESTGIWVDESLLTPENLETAATLAQCVHSQMD